MVNVKNVSEQLFVHSDREYEQKTYAFKKYNNYSYPPDMNLLNASYVGLIEKKNCCEHCESSNNCIHIEKLIANAM